eukprot:143448-Chlamydomonas_euryale.AAC.2
MGALRCAHGHSALRVGGLTLGDKDVLALQVSVQDVLGVDVVQGKHNLHEPATHVPRTRGHQMVFRQPSYFRAWHENRKPVSNQSGTFRHRHARSSTFRHSHARSSTFRHTAETLGAHQNMMVSSDSGFLSAACRRTTSLRSPHPAYSITMFRQLPCHSEYKASGSASGM